MRMAGSWSQRLLGHLEDGLAEDEEIAVGCGHHELALAVGLIDGAAGGYAGCVEFGLELREDGGNVFDVNVIHEAAVAGWDFFPGRLRGAQDAYGCVLALDVGVDGGVDPGL